MTFEDRPVDVLAVQVAVFGTGGSVAGLEDDIDDLTQRLEQGEEYLEELGAGDGGGQHRHLDFVAPVPEDVEAVSLPRLYRPLSGGPNRVGQLKVAGTVRGETEIGSF